MRKHEIIADVITCAFFALVAYVVAYVIMFMFAFLWLYNLFWALVLPLAVLLLTNAIWFSSVNQRPEMDLGVVSKESMFPSQGHPQMRNAAFVGTGAKWVMTGLLCGGASYISAIAATLRQAKQAREDVKPEQ